jgi:hypothetical protein
MRQLFFLLLSVPLLIGCNPVYTTHLVSGPNSFESDKRLVGTWNFGRLHIEHNPVTAMLYGIQHEESCTVSPIYTTRINDQWFMNIDVAGKFSCASSEKVPVEENELRVFGELYQLAGYRIKILPIEDILPNIDALLQTLGEENNEEFIEAMDNMEKEFGFRWELTDVEAFRGLLDRLRILLKKQSELDSGVALEVLEIASIPQNTVKEFITSGRLSGVILPLSQCDGCKAVVITDTADKTKTLLEELEEMARTRSINPPQEKDDANGAEKLFEQLRFLWMWDDPSGDSQRFFRLTAGGQQLTFPLPIL